jgi:two-component system, NtrC family, C4-dicarboxylate transport sensor histidine kinase DctB
MADRDQAQSTALAPEQLAQINRLTTIARFVSGLAHELNNALQVMGGQVELLADRDDLPAEAARRIGKIGAQADRASGVIRQVLAFVRDPGGERRTVDLGLIVDSALSLRRYQLGRAGVSVTWSRGEGVRLPVRGDERQLQQIVLNLLVNAEEALAGQPERRLDVTASRAGGRVAVAVHDTGAGVPADLRDRIFEPFFTTRASEGAVGLGLTVGAAIAAAHGGRLSLDTDSAPAARFVLDLPESAPS